MLKIGGSDMPWSARTQTGWKGRSILQLLRFKLDYSCCHAECKIIMLNFTPYFRDGYVAGWGLIK